MRVKGTYISQSELNTQPCNGVKFKTIIIIIIIIITICISVVLLETSKRTELQPVTYVFNTYYFHMHQ